MCVEKCAWACLRGNGKLTLLFLFSSRTYVIFSFSIGFFTAVYSKAMPAPSLAESSSAFRKTIRTSFYFSVYMRRRTIYMMDRPSLSLSLFVCTHVLSNMCVSVCGHILSMPQNICALSGCEHVARCDKKISEKSSVSDCVCASSLAHSLHAVENTHDEPACICVCVC